MEMYWNKRRRLHKKRGKLPQDLFGTPTWPPFHCLAVSNMAAVTSCENTLQYLQFDVEAGKKLFLRAMPLRFSLTTEARILARWIIANEASSVNSALLVVNGVFSLTWSATMQIYWNKRRRLHKKSFKLPQDLFGTPTQPPFHCLGTPIWPP